MRLLMDIGLCIEFTEMVKCKVSPKTIEKWSAPCKIKDPADRRKALFVYAELRPKYQKLVETILCGGIEPGEYYLQSQIAKWLPPVKSTDRRALDKYTIDRSTSDFETGEIANRSLTCLPAKTKNLYILQSRWLRLIDEGFKSQKHVLTTLQINSVATFREVAVTIANTKGAKLPTNDNVLRRKLRAYRKEGITALISKKFGNTNTQKVDDMVLQYLIDYYGDSKKYTTPMVTRWINDTAKENNWKGFPITEATVFNNLNRANVKPVWYLTRHGFSAWKPLYENTQIRFKPNLPNALWVGDDTKVNLYYKKGKDTKASLNVYAIMDAHSGYWLGWSFVEGSVKASDVREAFRMAVRRSNGQLPFQMQYDGDSANSFYERLSTLHFPCMPYNGQSKLIERYFGKVQREFMRYDDAFTGQNIQSKSQQSKINPEAIIPYANKEEAIKAQSLWFEVMNNYKGQDGKRTSAKEMWLAKQNPECQTMTATDERELLWEWTKSPITYTRLGIKMERKGIKHYYEVLDGRIADLEFATQNIGVEFRVRYNPHSMNEVALYTKDERFVAMAQNKERLPMAVQDYREGERELINEKLQVKKDQKAIMEHKRKVAKMVSNSDAAVNAGFTVISKEVMNAAEADLYEEQVNDNPTKPTKSIEQMRREMAERKDQYS